MRTIDEIQADINQVDATAQALEKRGSTGTWYWRLQDRLDDLFSERIEAGGSYPAGSIALVD